MEYKVNNFLRCNMVVNIVSFISKRVPHVLIFINLRHRKNLSQKIIYRLYHSHPWQICNINSRELDKIKNTEFLLNEPDVSSIYFDFLSSPCQKTISLLDETSLILFLTHSRLKLIDNPGSEFSLTIKKIFFCRFYTEIECVN